MIAIHTIYQGPTDHHGARVRVTDHNGQHFYLPWPYEMSTETAHAWAACCALRKWNRFGIWKGGGFNGGYCYVLVDVSDGEQIEVGYLSKYEFRLHDRNPERISRYE